ncbi:MAG: hypothetical protein M3Z08_05305, partial [Chloroflexota bacterium]|nr:hypothetical protein [Chloroflexota bacterium]
TPISASSQHVFAYPANASGQRTRDQSRSYEGESAMALCVVAPLAGAMFPPGERMLSVTSPSTTLLAHGQNHPVIQFLPADADFVKSSIA